MSTPDAPIVWDGVHCTGCGRHTFAPATTRGRALRCKHCGGPGERLIFKTDPDSKRAGGGLLARQATARAPERAPDPGCKPWFERAERRREHRLKLKHERRLEREARRRRQRVGGQS